MARLKIADLEIERKDDPFEYETEDGSVYTFQDPKAIQAEDLLHFEEMAPVDQVRLTIADAKFDAFLKHPEVDMYCFSAVMDAYAKHYGLGTVGEGRASKRSSRGTAKR